MVHGELLWKAGTLIEDDLFVTGNFGSKAPYNFSQMQEFLMSMVRNGHSCVWSSGMAGSIVGKNRLSHGIRKNWQKLFERYWSKALLTLHVPRWYKLPFMNGCSARGTLDLPQVTSYDYDALLDEEREIQLPNIWQSRR